MKLNNLVRAAIFAALAIGVGFSLLLIPNIELITVTIFISGLTLGSAWGMLIGGTAEIIFSSLNPLGSGLSFPPTFFQSSAFHDNYWCHRWMVAPNILPTCIFL